MKPKKWPELIEWDLGSEIFKRFGIDGFYLQDLFRFEPELYEMMSKSIEMGRAFIIKEYQQKTDAPIFTLERNCAHNATVSRTSLFNWRSKH